MTAFVLVASSAALFFVIRRVIPARLISILAAALPSLLVLVWWLDISASQDRTWIAEVEHPARVKIDGDRLTIENVRNFDYRSGEDYTPRWETREYDLSKLRGVDLFFSTWGSPLIAHTIASWDFGEDQHLAVSIETRKEVGEEYSASSDNSNSITSSRTSGMSSAFGRIFEARMCASIISRQSRRSPERSLSTTSKKSIDWPMNPPGTTP